MEAPILKIRREAKETLKGSWGTAIGMMFTEFGIYYGFSIVLTIFAYIFGFIVVIATFIPMMSKGHFDISDLSATVIAIWIIAAIFIIGFIVVGVSLYYSLTIGKNAWYYAKAKGENPKFGVLFSWFFKAKKTVKSIKLYFWRLLFSFLWSFIVIIPAGILGGVGAIFALRMNEGISLTSDIPSLFTLVFFGGMLLIFICYLLYIVIIQRYALANYLLVDDESRTAKGAMDLSVKLMKGRAFDIVLLFLSILGLVLIPYAAMIAGYILAFVLNAVLIGLLMYFLSFFVMIGLLIYFYPWFEMAIAKYTLWAIEQNKNKYPENEINA